MAKSGGIELEEKKVTRQVWVDYLKACACLAVVIFHVIYGLQNAGIYTNPSLNVLKEFCDIFQIPIFMMASGYLYGMAGKPSSYLRFEKKKLINLFVPYIVFSLVYFGINSVFSSSVNFSYDIKTLLMLPVKPIAQYWFLFALMLIFILVPLLEKVIKNEYILLFIFFVWKLLAMNGFLFDEKFAIDYYLAGYTIFFYMGTTYARKHDDFKFIREKCIYILVCLFIVLFAAAFFIKGNNMFISYYRFGLNMVSIVAFTVLFEKKWEVLKCRFIDIIAKYSFQIYLLHTMATAAVRIVLAKLGMYNDLIHFIIALITGIFVSVTVAVICDKTGYLNILFYPISTYKKIKHKDA